MMRPRLLFTAILLVVSTIALAQDPARVRAIHGTPGTIHPEIWPVFRSPLPPDAKLEAAVDALLGRMTLEEKVAQTIQPSIASVKPEDVRQYHFGSILNGGGGWPGDVRKVTPKDWLALADAFYTASVDTSGGKQAIPVIWGADAVHGHNNIVGATLFPHNVGLGAMRNPDLVRRIGEVTAVEMAATGIDWNFSPTVAVCRDDRWGRCYESWSEDPFLVRAYAAAMVEGLQGAPSSAAFLGRGKVIATSKHFIGDGGTFGGKDQGDNRASETQLRDIHGPGYFGALGAGVQSVMASYNSWHGVKMHGFRALLTDVLKNRMGFDGIVVGDWNGHGQIPGCTNKSCPQALNAGLDMYMVPEDWKALYENTLAQARSGEIPAARLDDAVRRILRVKMRAGLFGAPAPSKRNVGGRFELIGAPEHRAVARQAVRESLVLLKNNGHVLPLLPKQRILVAGDGANDIGKQTGGWTLSWQGTENRNTDFPGAKSIWDGIRSTVESAGGTAVLSPDGSYSQKPDAAIVVFGENPYAEFEGDRKHLVYDRPGDLEILRKLDVGGIPVVAVFLSGRPLWVNPYLNASDAFVAAWLPGTEGDGVADVLFTAADGSIRHDFRGKTAFSWPRLATQTVLNREDPGYDPLFPLGFGLSYADDVSLPELPTDTSGVQMMTGNVWYTTAPVAPWRVVDRGNDLYLTGGETLDLSRESNGNLAIAADVRMTKRPAADIVMSLGCGPGCAGAVNVTPMLRELPLNEWRTIRIRLRCFADAGADVARIDTPFRLTTTGKLDVEFRNVQVLPGIEGAACPPAAVSSAASGVMFDDFTYQRPADMEANRWILRTKAGWPGVPGAKWGHESFSMHDDPQTPGNRVLRMTSETSGTPETTRQTQFCHERKYLQGTYAARVRFTDEPSSGPDGDQVVETFYLISPIKEPLHPDYSEADFEYLPNGGWGKSGATMFATTWETFRLEPWLADNESSNLDGSYAGWRTLVATVANNEVKYWVDGKPLAVHTSRVYPEVPMSMNFNLWFIREGVLKSSERRQWIQDVDWVFHRAGSALTTAEVEKAVADFRARSVKFTDSVPAVGLESPCDF